MPVINGIDCSLAGIAGVSVQDMHDAEMIVVDRHDGFIILKDRHSTTPACLLTLGAQRVLFVAEKDAR